MTRPGLAIPASCLTLLLAAPAAAQTVECWVGLPFVSGRVDSSFTTSYTPTLSYSSDATGHAGETVTLTGSRPRGIEGGLNLFFTRHAGIQLIASYDSADLTGSLGEYALRLDYTARQPPDYVSRPYSYSHTFPGGTSTTGTLHQLTLSANAVGRITLGPRVGLEVSGGVTYFRPSGDAVPLDYTVFQLGGHSVLFYDAYKLTYDLEPAHSVGLNVGASLDVSIAPWLALTTDARYFGGPDVDLPIVVTGQTEDSEAYLTHQSAATIQATLRPGSVTVTPGRSRLLIGIKFRL